MNLVRTARSVAVENTDVLRAVWLLIVGGVVGLVVVAAPLGYEMLQSDYYGYGTGLKAVGLSVSFFAAYFVNW